MSRTELVFDAVTISSSGGTATSNKVDAAGNESFALYVDGDSNTSDIDVRVEAKLRDVAGDSWAEHNASNTNVDVSSTSNGAKTFQFDVTNLIEVRFVLTNNAASNTTVTGLVGVEP